MKRFCLALDLRPDPDLRAKYIEHHQHVWPEIQQSLFDAGILDMQIYNLGYHLSMIIDTADDFTFERKAQMDRNNPKVAAWEAMMAEFQNVDDGADPYSRWQPMEKVFQLEPQA
jgi:L-rhamnose mutarotase